MRTILLHFYWVSFSIEAHATLFETIYRTIKFYWTASVVSWSEFLATNPKVLVSFRCATRFFCVALGLERSSLSLVRINEELLERKVVAPV
jgi:hypothetical protein